VLGPVLPVTVADPIPGVDVRVAVEVVVVVDGDVVVSPTGVPPPATTPGRAHRNADPKRDRCAGGVVTRRRIVDGRIGIHGRPIHGHRVVRRHVHHLGVRLLDDDHVGVVLRLRRHDLLFGGLQRALVLRLPTHALDRRHHVSLLREKGVAEIRRPLNVVRQTLNKIR